MQWTIEENNKGRLNKYTQYYSLFWLSIVESIFSNVLVLLIFSLDGFVFMDDFSFAMDNWVFTKILPSNFINTYKF